MCVISGVSPPLCVSSDVSPYCVPPFMLTQFRKHSPHNFMNKASMNASIYKTMHNPKYSDDRDCGLEGIEKVGEAVQKIFVHIRALGR